MGEFPSFTAFYQALHQRDPFPWQRALAEQVSTRGWADVVDVPTGLGKTTTMTVAVWELARQVHAGGVRTTPLRVVHIVDRTTLVDQTHADLRTLHAALHEAAGAGSDGPVGAVARALVDAYGTPLMLGHAHGSDRDDGWIHSASVPVVVTMTAHQAVSRLLFRGFGISPGMSPVHAALLGVDALLLVDEPHLSTAALSTLRAAARLQREACALPVPHARVVAMGATVPADGGDVFQISSADVEHPVAGARLAAQKRLEVVTTSSTGDKDVQKALIASAKDALKADPDQSVAVVCNTVAVARAVHAELVEKVSSDALLVTSRVRSHERAGMNAALGAVEIPRLIVATQTVEAGVDLSVPTLITETSEWSSLVQRIGRVNRYGIGTGRVVLVATPEGKSRPAAEAIYGEAAAGMVTLAAHLENGVDVSPLGLQRLRDQHAELVEHACVPHPPAPTLTAETLPTLAHTNPRPAADVDVQPFITGVPERDRVEDVTVAWRDLTDPRVLDSMPPTPEELVSVPLAAVQHLLQRRLDSQAKAGAAPMVGDAAQAAEPGSSRWSDDADRVVVSIGGQWRIATSHEDLAPGAWIVLNTGLGGHDATGWNPDSAEPVLDLSTHYRHARGEWWLLTSAALIVLHTLGTLSDEPDTTVAEKLTAAEPEEVDELVEDLVPTDLGPLQVGSLSEHGLWVRPQPEDGQTEQLVALNEHARHVAERARHAAIVLALPEHLVTTLEWAGYRHDDGKDNDAFQARLQADPHGVVLAKQHPRRSEIEDVLPRGWRHESASAQRLVTEQASAMLVHLVAAHHGWARPLMPAARGPEQALATAVRFTELNDQWGPWGLAWAETLVRLADHQASAAPETGHAAPSASLPRENSGDQPGTSVATRHEHILSGIPADEHLHWWAAAGALAAATEIDPYAQLRFDPHVAGSVPVLLTDVDLQSVAEQVVALRESVGRVAHHHPGLGEKTEKLQASTARNTLTTLDQQPPSDRATAAALLDDTQAPDTSGKVEPRVPWRHGNSSLIKGMLEDAHTPDQVVAALTSDDAEQHDDAKMFGLLPTGVDPAPVTGIAHNGRGVLLPLVVAATGRFPATGSSRPAGTTADRRRVLPMPQHPVGWVELVALLQTLPQLPRRPWADCGINTSAWVERPAHGKTFGWIGA